jgi:regulator of RNase E activity RraA
MSVTRHDIVLPEFTAELLDAWSVVPSAVASDSLGRFQGMAAAISPVASGTQIVGRARTVECMVGDNSALHAAIGLCEPGLDILVCNAQGFEDSALFGGLMTRASLEQGVVGLVIDGAVRDSAEIAESGFPCYCRAIVPRGPHKGFGGVIDGTITCGGVPVSSGDLVIGDDDGITIVPFDELEATMERVQEILAREQRALSRIAEGGSLAEVYGVPEITLIP